MRQSRSDLSYRASSPPQIEGELFYDELRFWNLDEHLVESFIDEDMVCAPVLDT